MQNKEKATRLVGIVIKEYGKEIIAEGSKAVMGLEDHIDRIIAEILGVESEAITAAREWRKIIQRAAMTEGIDKVIINLSQENSILTEERTKDKKQENETEEATRIQGETNKADANSTKEVEMILEENQPIPEKEAVYKEKVEKMEGIKITPKGGTAKEILYKKVGSTTKEIKEEVTTGNKNVSLNQSIWAPNKDSCRDKGSIKAKVVAVNVLGNNAEQREKTLRWSIGKNVHLQKITEKFEKGNLWCILIFDCLKGYEEVREKLENKKEEYEKVKLLLDEEIKERVEKENTRKQNKIEKDQETK